MLNKQFFLINYDCFYVHYKYQNSSIGKLLLNHIFKIVKEENIVKIKVDVSIKNHFLKSLSLWKLRKM